MNTAANFGSFVMIPDVSKTEAVISWQFAYRGSAEEAAPYLAPFDAIEAVSTDTGDVPYPEIAYVHAVGEEDAACTGSIVRVLTTAGLETYNVTAEHQIWDSFTKRIAENPDLVSMAIIIHEGYSTKAVQDRDRASTAYPFRGDHLMQFQGNLPPDSGLEEQMLQWATEVQDLWNAGQPNRLPDAYVNYASGFESVQEWYGHELWRVTKLRGLKAKYDPFNRFRFYNPIV